MTLFSAFVSSLAVVSCHLSRSTNCDKLPGHQNGQEKPRKVLVTCGPNWPCPENSVCMKISSKEGFCVLEVEDR